MWSCLALPVALLAALLLAGCDDGAAPAATPADTPRPTVSAAAPVDATASATATPAGSPMPRSDPTYTFPIEPASASDFHTDVNGHGYPAIDVFAAEGTAIVSVTSGVVAFVNRVDRWSDPPDDGATRGGLYLAVLGDDGLQYYFSHLADVRADLDAGVRVEAGEPLGHVGTTGNARLTPAHLHFGISCPTVPDDWERRRGEFDPIPYLVAWEAGDAGASPAGAYLAAC